jgi:hypothetical protein
MTHFLQRFDRGLTTGSRWAAKNEWNYENEHCGRPIFFFRREAEGWDGE